MILTAQVVPLMAGLLLCLIFWILLRISSSPAYRERLEAEHRAERLMAEILTSDEYRQVKRKGYLDIQSPTHPGRFYRVPRSREQVRVYERGRLVEHLCIQSIEPVPYGDIVVMHKLMIQGDEQEYLRLANHFH